MSGYIIYQGPSLIGGQPIVVIAVPSIRNAKTGPALQTYILRSDIDPVEAVRTRQDVSICGNCRHRGPDYRHRSCYVLVFQGPLAVYRAFVRGAYKITPPAKVPKALVVRIGTYGDPAVVPRKVWDDLIKGAPGHTGYSHSCDIQPLKGLVQASADSEAEALTLQAQGYKTFRVRGPNDPVMPGEMECPASEERGKRVTCSQCKVCNGVRQNVTIKVHGQVNIRRNFSA